MLTEPESRASATRRVIRPTWVRQAPVYGQLSVETTSQDTTSTLGYPVAWLAMMVMSPSQWDRIAQGYVLLDLKLEFVLLLICYRLVIFANVLPRKSVVLDDEQLG